MFSGRTIYIFGLLQLAYRSFSIYCTPLYTGKRRLFAIPYELGHLSTLHVFWVLLGALRGMFQGIP